MLTVVRDDYGMLQAACDWWPVDAQGRWEPKGTTIWVNQLEVNQPGDTRRMIRQITEEIVRLTPWATGAYWERRDRGGRLKQFSKRQLYREEGMRV